MSPHRAPPSRAVHPGGPGALAALQGAPRLGGTEPRGQPGLRGEKAGEARGKANVEVLIPYYINVNVIH